MKNIVQSSSLDTSKQTPIEIALQIDEQGRTTARALYDFLELAKGQFSRWVKTNILENRFAEENVDYEVFDIYVENPQGGRPSQDYKLTAPFAKKLAMMCNNEQGEQARAYFLAVEEKLKGVVQKAPQLASELEVTKIQAQKTRAEAMLLNAKNRTFQTIMSSIKDKNLSPIAVQVFGLKGLEGAFGVEVGGLLPETERTYSATEIGRILGGISANKIGSLAKANGMKTEEYGVWVMDKSRHSAKEVPNFRYNEKAIEKFKELIS